MKNYYNYDSNWEFLSLFLKRISVKGWILLSILFLFPQIVYPQTDVEKATRETDIQSRQEKIQEKLKQIPEKLPEPKAKEIPATKEEEKFFIKKIRLEGCETISCDEFSSIIKEYENKEVTVTQLKALAKELEGDYLKRGIIAAVFIPEQQIKDNELLLRAVEAKMGKVTIQDHKYFKKENLFRYWAIPSDAVLRYDKLSKSIQMMNKNPDRQVKASLLAGTKPGTTDVVLTPKTHFPIHLTGSFDREGGVSTGMKRTGFGIRHNNFLGLDDTFLGGYNFGRSFCGQYYYHSIPLNSKGTSLLYGYSYGKSMPLKEYAEINIRSLAENTTFSLQQDVYKKGEYLGNTFLKFDTKDKTVKSDTGVINRDRLRIINVGIDYIKRLAGSTTSVTPEYSRGVSSFGATGHNNPLASRGASPTFNKANLGIRHQKILPLNLQANFNFKGQFADVKLTPQEEFDLGGIDSVRGYPASDYLADNGAYTNMELIIPAFFIPDGWKLPYEEEVLKNRINGVVFLDYGWGMRKEPLINERDRMDLLAAGFGFRVSLFNQASLRLEWGFPLADNHPITEEGNSRFHFSVDFQEKLPEEIERVKNSIREENIKHWTGELVDEQLNAEGNPIRNKLLKYMYLANMYYEKGQFKKARMCYMEILNSCKSLSLQAEDYARSCLAHKEELKKYQKSAILSYEQGNIQESKEMWQKIIDEAEQIPLKLEF